MSNANYETDFAAWSEQQAELLQRHATDGLDWANLADEIASLSRSDRREIRSRLAIICEYLLKWKFQPAARSPSWESSIRGSRDKIADLIEESPSLAGYAAAYFAGAYARGRKAAANETRIVDLPEIAPWTMEQVLDAGFWP